MEVSVEMPELVGRGATEEEMEKLTEEGKEKEKGHVEGGDGSGDDTVEGSDWTLADDMWEEVRGVRMKSFFLGLKWPGLATFMVQVAPSWVDVGSDWVAGWWWCRVQGTYIFKK